MPQSKKRVVVTRKLPDPVETRMMELFSTVLNLSDEPMSREQLAAAGFADLVDRAPDSVLAMPFDHPGLITRFSGARRV